MQRVVLSFLVAFVLLMIVIVLTRVSYNNVQAHSGEVDRTREVIGLYNSIDVELRSAELFTPTYEVPGAIDLYSLYKADLNRIEPNLKLLKFKVQSDRRQAAIADSLERILLGLLPTLRQKNMPEMINTEGFGRLADLRRAHLLIQQGVQREEDALAVRRKELVDANNRNNLFTLVLSVLAILLISFTFLSQFFLRRKSLWLEGFLDSILNTTQNGIVYLKPVRAGGAIADFTVTYANHAVKELTGAGTQDFIGKPLSQLDPAATKGEAFHRFVHTAETGEPVQFEYRFGKGRPWLYLSVAKLNDGVTVAIQNIAALKRTEKELKTNIAALEQSNAELEEYAYAASHDLQEPLRKIRTFGDFLQETQASRMDDKGRSHLQKILQSTERMSLLIKDLLSFSSLKQREAFVPTDLNEVLEKVLQDLEVMISQAKAVITHDPLPETHAIPVQMNQLFYNLVNNALKFARADVPLHLDVSCRTVVGKDIGDVPGLKPERQYHEIVFSDNGIGFNQDYAQQIFGLFKRLNNKSTYAGSGIGLSLCKKVVANHGGVIAANGKEGIGAQFYIYLPVSRPLLPTTDPAEIG